MAAEFQSFALSDYFFVLDGAVEGFQRSEGLGVAHHLHLGEFTKHCGHGAAMVRLVVIDDQVVHFAALEHRLHLEEVFFQEIGLHGIDEGHLFIYDEIGVVGHAVGQLHVVFKLVGVTVVDTDIINVIG